MAVATKSAAKSSKAASKTQAKAKGGKASKAVKAVGKAQNASQPAPKASTTNPYRPFGGYWATVEALRSLGVGKMFAFTVIVPAVRKAMGDAWKAFAAKEGKLTADERVLMNVMVCSRKDYGRPLVGLGYEVRWDGREKTAGIFKVSK